jgi:hypothetical protein
VPAAQSSEIVVVSDKRARAFDAGSGFSLPPASETPNALLRVDSHSPFSVNPTENGQSALCLRACTARSPSHSFCQARNEEKAQSMLYRFREAQAAELGLGTRSDRRPKMASTCKSLRECERWRGEILREISRKVSKIQDGKRTRFATSCHRQGDTNSVSHSWPDRL